jgi:PEP-CTERM motif
MHGSLAPRSWRCLVTVAVTGFLMCTGLPARGGIVVSLQSVSASAGTSGNTLEVDVSNTGAPVDIASFSFEISVAPSSGVTFTGADISTATTYIFAGNSAFGPNIDTLTGTTLDASDLAVSGATTLGTNETLALGRVLFNVASSAPLGAAAVTFTGFPATSLTAMDLSNIPIDTLSNNGTITITAAVPEPSTLVTATLALFGGFLLIRGKRSTDR